ncbi:MAG: hypothetical protein SNJ52_03975, partial [Verrucomicrobiia bacterium]
GMSTDETLAALLITPGAPAEQVASTKVVAVAKGARPVVVAMPQKPVVIAKEGSTAKPRAIPVAAAAAQVAKAAAPPSASHAGSEAIAAVEAAVTSLTPSSPVGHGSAPLFSNAEAPPPTVTHSKEDLAAAIRGELRTMKTVDWPTLRKALHDDFPSLALKDVLQVCAGLGGELAVWRAGGTDLFLWTATSESAHFS